MSFRTRVACLIAAVVASVTLIITGGFLYVADAQAKNSLDVELEKRSAVVAKFLKSPQRTRLLTSSGYSPSQIRFLSEEKLFGPYVAEDVLIQVVDGRGRILLSNVDPIPISRDVKKIAGARGNYALLETINIGGTDIAQLRVRSVSLSQNRVLMVASPMDKINKTMEGLENIALVTGFSGAAVSALLGFFVAGRVVRPIRQLTVATSSVANSLELDDPIDLDLSLDLNLDLNRKDELGELAKSFNLMLSELIESRRQQQRLVTDASHELRTPLTSLRTNIEFMSRAEKLSNEEKSQITDDILFELDELTDLVSELVDLATDRHQMEAPSVVDFSDIVKRVVERHMRRSDCFFVVDTELCKIKVEPSLAERAVSNLISNAVKWSPSAGIVEVTVRDGSLTVRDHGPGIAEEETELIFERFYRSASSPSAEGSGLGLSIVRHIAESFGGSTQVVEHQGDGAAIALSFPLSQESL
jgi:two-component system sensor histidine kinase MprB